MSWCSRDGGDGRGSGTRNEWTGGGGTPARAGPAPAAGGRSGTSIRNAGYLRKWFLLGIAIGFVADLRAVVFYLALKYTGGFLLGYLAGYHIPAPVGECGAEAQRLNREAAEAERERRAPEVEQGK